MNKKASQFLGKIWKMTAFSIFSEPGKKQSQLIQQSFENIFKAFSIFEKSVSSTFNELRNHKLNIPALIKVRQDFMKQKPKIQKFIEIETSSIENMLSELSSFKFVLQKSQKNVLLIQQQSISEYEQRISSFLAGKEESLVSMRKMEKIHEEFMNLKYDYKIKIRDHQSSSSFQKWLADFHVRAQEFFMKSYSYDWQYQTGIKKQQKLDEIEIENKYQQEFEILFDKQSDIKNYEKSPQSFEMQEDQNDIVGQIYKEFQNTIPKHIL